MSWKLPLSSIGWNEWRTSTSKGDVVVGGCIDLSRSTRVVSIEGVDGIGSLNIVIYLPTVMTNTIALPFDQIFDLSIT